MSYEETARPIIHLIEDDLAVRHSTELLLHTAGIDVRAYASGIEFLNDANPNEIRLLLIDVNMPGIDGIDLLDRLRRGGIMASAIFITARGITAELRAAAARTGSGVLIKPFKPGELITRVKKTFDKI
jgi:two-component system response regulator FixJ